MQPTRPPARPQADPSLDIDLAATLAESQAMSKKITPNAGPWDVIIVGSGAAGGMAAFQLATAGIKVLVARGRADARLAEGVPDDGVAVPVAPSPAACRPTCAA